MFAFGPCKHAHCFYDEGGVLQQTVAHGLDFTCQPTAVTLENDHEHDQHHAAGNGSNRSITRFDRQNASVDGVAVTLGLPTLQCGLAPGSTPGSRSLRRIPFFFRSIMYITQLHYQRTEGLKSYYTKGTCIS